MLVGIYSEMLEESKRKHFAIQQELINNSIAFIKEVLEHTEDNSLSLSNEEIECFTYMENTMPKFFGIEIICLNDDEEIAIQDDYSFERELSDCTSESIINIANTILKLYKEKKIEFIEK